MSRWEEQFKNHPIHENLKKVNEFLDTNFSEMNAETIIEKRRLLKIIQTVGNFVKNIDSEVVPIHILNSINNPLQNTLVHLQTFQQRGDISSLQNANNQLDALLQNFPLFMVGGKKGTTEKLLKSIEKLFDDYTQNLGNMEKELKEKFDKNLTTTNEQEAKLKSLSDLVDKKTTEITGMKETWQAEHSNNLKKSKDDFDSKILEYTDSMKIKHDEMLTQCGLVMGDTIAGGHIKSAKDQESETLAWSAISLLFLFLTIGWAVFSYFNTDFTNTQNIALIAHVIQAASVVSIGIFGAVYALKKSNWYRNNGERKRQFALEIAAIPPFIESLAPEEQHKLRSKLTEKLFGNFYSESNGSSKGTDINLLKEIAEIVKALNPKQ